MRKLKMTTLCVSVHGEEENPVFGEYVTKISIDDESGGPFIRIEQDNNTDMKGVAFDSIEEMEMVWKAATGLMDQFKKEGDSDEQ